MTHSVYLVDVFEETGSWKGDKEKRPRKEKVEF